MKKKRSKGGEGAVLSSLSGTGKVLNYIGMAVICFISLFPVIWVFISSLKADPMAEPGFTLPSQICLDGYVGVFRYMHIMRYFSLSSALLLSPCRPTWLRAWILS